MTRVEMFYKWHSEVPVNSRSTFRDGPPEDWDQRPANAKSLKWLSDYRLVADMHNWIMERVDDYSWGLADYEQDGPGVVLWVEVPCPDTALLLKLTWAQ